MIHIFGPKDNKPNCTVINTTTSSKIWSRELSPMLLGPVRIPMMPHAHRSQNVENAWQFSKVYKQFTDKDGNPTESYWKWAVNGFNDKWAHRYPMGRNKTPLYSLWDDQRYDYIGARKAIYIPTYKQAVIKSEAFSQLKELYKQEKEIALFDFDGYCNKNLSWDDIINNPKRKMGHAFVLGMLLEES